MMDATINRQVAPPKFDPAGHCPTCKFWRLAMTKEEKGRTVFYGLCRYYPPDHNLPVTAETHLCAFHEDKRQATGNRQQAEEKPPVAA